MAQLKDHTDRRTGIACLWIGVGSLNPSFARFRKIYGLDLYLLKTKYKTYSSIREPKTVKTR